MHYRKARGGASESAVVGSAAVVQTVTLYVFFFVRIRFPHCVFVLVGHELCCEAHASLSIGTYMMWCAGAVRCRDDNWEAVYQLAEVMMNRVMDEWLTRGGSGIGSGSGSGAAAAGSSVEAITTTTARL